MPLPGQPHEWLHVMHMYSRLDIGGIERLLVELLPRLNGRRYHVSLCLIKSAGALAEDLRRRGVSLHVLPLRGRLRPSSLAALVRLFRGGGRGSFTRTCARATRRERSRPCWLVCRW